MLLNPEDVSNKKRGKVSQSQVNEIELDRQISSDSIIEPVEVSSNYKDYSGTVKIVFESGGRFGNPEVIYVRDYKASHINSLVTTKEEKLLETLVHCLNECVVDPPNFRVENLTDKEFFELMLGMKMSFDVRELEYYFYHSCQDHLPEKDRKTSVDVIPLDNIKMVSIEEADDRLRNNIKERLYSLNEDEYRFYLESKYGKDCIFISKEEELNKIKVKEPIIIRDYDDTLYEFRFVRIRDLIEANNIVSKEYDTKIRIEKSKPINKKNELESAISRDIAIDDLNRKKAERFIDLIRTMCLVAKVQGNSRIVFNTLEEKIKESEKMSRRVYLNYMNAVSMVEYGVNHEFEYTCNLCDSGEVLRGFLQRDVSPINLLPVSVYTNDSTKRKHKKHTGFEFYF